jgi:hypothetical protein
MDLYWIRYKATDSQRSCRTESSVPAHSQLRNIDEEYKRTLRIASLAEKWRQLKTDKAFAQLEQALDLHWKARTGERPVFKLYMFVDNTTGGHIYGSLEDCLEAACEVLDLDYEAEMLPGNLLSQIKDDCLTNGRFKHQDFGIFLESR